MTITIRKNSDRGHTNIGWLNSYHTFDFSGFGPYNGFHDLRIINEDRVAPGQGFGKHPHSEMEIFSYVLSGALEHKDSMNNVEVLRRGDVQFTSAGSGIRHSEYNGSNTEWVHFLQIWVIPAVSVNPRYETKRFSEEEKRGKLRLIVSPDETDGSIRINQLIIVQDVKMYASIVQKDEEVNYTFSPGRAGYIHVADTQGSVKINDVTLQAGDGAYISGEEAVKIVGLHEQSEFVLFDLRTSK